MTPSVNSLNQKRLIRTIRYEQTLGAGKGAGQGGFFVTKRSIFSTTLLASSLL